MNNKIIIFCCILVSIILSIFTSCASVLITNSNGYDLDKPETHTEKNLKDRPEWFGNAWNDWRKTNEENHKDRNVSSEDKYEYYLGVNQPSINEVIKNNNEWTENKASELALKDAIKKLSDNMGFKNKEEIFFIRYLKNVDEFREYWNKPNGKKILKYNFAWIVYRISLKDKEELAEIIRRNEKPDDRELFAEYKKQFEDLLKSTLPDNIKYNELLHINTCLGFLTILKNEKDYIELIARIDEERIKLDPNNVILRLTDKINELEKRVAYQDGYIAGLDSLNSINVTINQQGTGSGAGSGPSSIPIPSLTPSSYNSINIQGSGSLNNKEALARFIRNKNPAASNSEITVIIDAYFTFAKEFGINQDIAIAQMCYITQYLKNQTLVLNHNYAGFAPVLTDNGEEEIVAFNTRNEGIKAHIQHLKGYSDNNYNPPESEIVTPRWDKLSEFKGTKKTLEEMAILWSPKNPNYANSIISIINELRQASE
jgi:hypothetical protein